MILRVSELGGDAAGEIANVTHAFEVFSIRQLPFGSAWHLVRWLNYDTASCLNIYPPSLGLPAELAQERCP